MGIKKTRHSDIECAQVIYNDLLNELYPLLKPYANRNGMLDLSTNDLTKETATILAHLLDCKIAIEDNGNSKYFCADDILAKQVIVENGIRLRYWGIIYWLDTPKEYEINQTQKDPFYAEFTLTDNTVRIDKMKCGDHDKTNLDKVWWFDGELNWIYEFEK